ACRGRDRRQCQVRRRDRQGRARGIQHVRGPRGRGGHGGPGGRRQQHLRVAAADTAEVHEHQAHPSAGQGHREGRQVDRRHGQRLRAADRHHPGDDRRRDRDRRMGADRRGARALDRSVDEPGPAQGPHRDDRDSPPRVLEL
ncbi:MAG: FIG01123047: hypothetical protein, partial [uncultured Nocardioidaceae bacterium]